MEEKFKELCSEHIQMQTKMGAREDENIGEKHHEVAQLLRK